jgi:transposase
MLVVVTHGVTQFKVGYPKDCREKMNFGRLNGLVHNFWGFDRFLSILEKHTLRRGISFERINEEGTSDFCHICGRKLRRPIRSAVICPVHGRMHADMNASLNMLKRYTPNYGDGEKASPVWVSYEWNKHLWLPRAKSLDYIQSLKAA